jgi:hypothetical protein
MLKDAKIAQYKGGYPQRFSDSGARTAGSDIAEKSTQAYLEAVGKGLQVINPNRYRAILYLREVRASNSRKLRQVGLIPTPFLAEGGETSP